MTNDAVSFTEDRIPLKGIEETIDELVDLYGGSIEATREQAREIILPLRRGIAQGGAVQCTVTWTETEAGDGSVTLVSDREIDAPKAQRILFLVAGVIGSVMFLLWPFFPGEKEYGTLAWLGGLVAFAVYLLTLKKSSGGMVYDFLQRLAARQRVEFDEETDEPLTPSA